MSDNQLAKVLKSRHVAMIALGGIIGAGLFVGSSAAIAAAGPAILISYALTGLIVLLLMRMLGEMALANPGAGAFTEYIREGLGHWAGFVCGWLYWFFWVVVIAVEAIAAGSLLEPLTGLPVWQSGLLLIAVTTGINLRSARTYGEFEFWLASIKVAAIVAFILLAAIHLCALAPPQAGAFSNLVAQGFAPHGYKAILVGVTSIIFTLVGAEIATVAAAESVAPERAVANLTTSLVLRVTVFYVLSLFFVLCLVPWNAVVPGKSPFLAALRVMAIPGAPIIMNFVVLTAVLSALNSALYVTSRVLFVLAAQGDAPGYLVRVNVRRVPARSILFSMLFACGGVIVSIMSAEVVFAFLINASGSVMLFVYLLLALAQINNRRVLEHTQPERLRLRIWLFPWLSYAVVVAIAGILAAVAFTKDLASQFYMSALSVFIALGAYALRKFIISTRKSLAADTGAPP
jgi:GABA permease